jgi:hypothetical protein
VAIYTFFIPDDDEFVHGKLYSEMTDTRKTDRPAAADDCSNIAGAMQCSISREVFLTEPENSV